MTINVRICWQSYSVYSSKLCFVPFHAHIIPPFNVSSSDGGKASHNVYVVDSINYELGSHLYVSSFFLFVWVYVVWQSPRVKTILIEIIQD